GRGSVTTTPAVLALPARCRPLRAGPPEWLAADEISLTLGRPEQAGFSLFSLDPEPLFAYAERAGLPPEARRDDRWLRDRFDLQPWWWVKLHYSRRRMSGC